MIHTLTALLAATCCQAAFGHGIAVEISAVNGRLHTNKDVFTATMQSAGGILYESEFPGYTVLSSASNIPVGTTFGFNVVDNLFYWAGGVLSSTTEALLFENALAAGVSIDQDTIFETGVPIGTYNGTTGWHEHGFYSLNGSAPAGAYGVVFTLTAPGFNYSNPFLLVFNRGLNSDDFSQAVADISKTQFGPPGDANGDGKVTGADYTIWADHFQNAGTLSEGDFNRDGKVTGADYTIWADNFAPAPSALGLAMYAVPEPDTKVLAIASLTVLAVIGACRGRRRR
jgi:hypothetical protein